MMELINFAFHPVNLLPTTLLIIVLLYWIVVFIGLLDLEFLHFDLHSHDGLHPHVEPGSHIDWHADGFLANFLSFFNLGKVPFMIYFSILVLFIWLQSLFVNYYLQIGVVWFALLLFIPYLLLAMFFTKIITNPLINVFQHNDKFAKYDEPFTGNSGVVVIAISPNSFGQIEVIRNNSSIKLNAYTTLNYELKIGEEILIVDYNHDKMCYLVEPFKPE